MYYRIWGKTYFKGAKRIRPPMIQINFQSPKNDNFPTQETKKHLICKKKGSERTNAPNPMISINLKTYFL